MKSKIKTHIISGALVAITNAALLIDFSEMTTHDVIIKLFASFMSGAMASKLFSDTKESTK